MKASLQEASAATALQVRRSFATLSPHRLDTLCTVCVACVGGGGVRVCGNRRPWQKPKRSWRSLRNNWTRHVSHRSKPSRTPFRKPPR